MPSDVRLWRYYYFLGESKDSGARKDRRKALFLQFGGKEFLRKCLCCGLSVGGKCKLGVILLDFEYGALAQACERTIKPNKIY